MTAPAVMRARRRLLRHLPDTVTYCEYIGDSGSDAVYAERWTGPALIRPAGGQRITEDDAGALVFHETVTVTVPVTAPIGLGSRAAFRIDSRPLLPALDLEATPLWVAVGVSGAASAADGLRVTGLMEAIPDNVRFSDAVEVNNYLADIAVSFEYDLTGWYADEHLTNPVDPSARSDDYPSATWQGDYGFYTVGIGSFGPELFYAALPELPDTEDEYTLSVYARATSTPGDIWLMDTAQAVGTSDYVRAFVTKTAQQWNLLGAIVVGATVPMIFDGWQLNEGDAPTEWEDTDTAPAPPDPDPGEGGENGGGDPDPDPGEGGENGGGDPDPDPGEGGEGGDPAEGNLFTAADPFGDTEADTPGYGWTGGAAITNPTSTVRVFGDAKVSIQLTNIDDPAEAALPVLPDTDDDYALSFYVWNNAADSITFGAGSGDTITEGVSTRVLTRVYIVRTAREWNSAETLYIDTLTTSYGHVSGVQLEAGDTPTTYEDPEGE